MQARGLLFVLWQAATAVLVREAELGLRPSVSLVGGLAARALVYFRRRGIGLRFQRKVMRAGFDALGHDHGAIAGWRVETASAARIINKVAFPWL